MFNNINLNPFSYGVTAEQLKRIHLQTAKTNKDAQQPPSPPVSVRESANACIRQLSHEEIVVLISLRPLHLCGSILLISIHPETQNPESAIRHWFGR